MSQLVPNGWQLVSLGRCCEVVGGATPRRDEPRYWGGDIPWVTPKDISELDEPVLTNPPESITEPGYRSASTRLLPAGSILFSSRAPIGLVAIAGRPMCTNQGFKSLIPGPDVDSRFLYHAIKRHVPRIQAMGNGATFKEVSKEVMERVEVALPKDVREQRRIAAILDKADAIRRKRRQALAETNTLLRSVFLEMFGDPATDPKCVGRAPLESFGQIMTGNTPSRAVADYFGNEIEWIKSDNINTPDHFLTPAIEGLSEQGKNIARIAPAGSILVTCIAGSPNCIGNVAITDRDVAFNQQINAIIPNRDTDLYFLYVQFILGKALVQRASTDSMKGMVSKSKFSDIKFIKPSHARQKEFGAIVKRHFEYFRGIALSAQTAESMFAALSQRAFRGEL